MLERQLGSAFAIGGVSDRQYIPCKFVQPLNELALSLGRPSITIDVRPIQLAKALLPMLVTLLGIINSPDKSLQSENALLPMLVTLLGIVIEVNPIQPEKALLPMLVTLLPIVTEVIPLQPEKALLPMLVTLLGIVIDVNPIQPEKALLPMLVTLLGIVIDVSRVIPSHVDEGIFCTSSPKVNEVT